MRLFSIRGTDVRCNVLLLLLIPVAAIFGWGAVLLTAFVSLSVHEAAHAVVAARLGYEVQTIEIQPFGFVARLSGAAMLFADQAAIYAAGPAASLLMAASGALTARLLPNSDWLEGFIGYNLIVAGTNLIPALPLDGGRLMQAALSGRASGLLIAMGALVGAAFVTISVLLYTNGILNPTFAVMGLFLIIASIGERKKIRAASASMPILVRQRIAKHGAIEVSHIAMSHGTRLSATIRQLPYGRYSVVTVLDDGMRSIGTLDETQIKQLASVCGTGAKLSDALRLSKRDIL